MKKTIPLPPPLNQTYKLSGGRMYKSKAAVSWQEQAGWLLKTHKPLEGMVLIQIYMYLKRDRDIDSSLKLLLDTLSDVGVYKNDSQIVDLRVIKIHDPKEPRMEIRIEEL